MQDLYNSLNSLQQVNYALIKVLKYLIDKEIKVEIPSSSATIAGIRSYLEGIEETLTSIEEVLK